MDLERISGLLLGIAALAAAAYLAKVILGIVMHRPIQMSDLAAAWRRVARAAAEHGDAKPVNDHLVASQGKVIAHCEDAARPMRVRVGLELWYARSAAPEQAPLPVGTPIEVTGVEGSILVVKACVLPSANADQVG